MNAFTSHLLVSVLILFLAERILHAAKASASVKRNWEVLLIILIVVYIVLGFFIQLP